MKTYGQVIYDEASRSYLVQCAPHVSMRLKRVFGKIAAGRSYGVHRIAATAENAADLQWFMSRYPMDVRTPEIERKAVEYQEGLALVDEILSGRQDAPPFELSIPARDYQRKAAALLLARRGLLLGDDVGLGKTASAICTLTDPRTRPAVVVTLTHLPRQWRAELARFAPALNVHIVKSAKPYDLRPKAKRQMSLLPAFPDVIILNYHKLAGWAETLAKLCNSVVFDEVQELRKEGTAKYASAVHLAHAMSFRMGLSATPIYNYGAEFWSVLNVLHPNSLGSKEEFGNEWCNGWFHEKATIAAPQAFGSYLRESGLMLRRTRADVGRELPPVQVIPHHVESDPAALDRVSGSCAELARLLLSTEVLERGRKMQVAEELSNKMRQATGIAKAPFVADFVRLLIESGERVVLYGWHREVYSIWMEKLADLNPRMYTGTESVAQKDAAKQAFLAGETPLLILSLRSGAGLDGLQKVCKVVVFGELDWSPGVHEQCVGRIQRDGQPDPVCAYYLLSEDGSDPVVAEVLGVKREQIDGVRAAPGKEEIVEHLQKDGSHIRRLAEAFLAKQRRGEAAA